MPARRSDSAIRRRFPVWLAPAGIVALTALALTFVLGLDGDREEREASTSAARSTSEAPITPTAVASADLSAQERRDAEDPLAEGEVDAPVTLVVFTDYQCQYCARWTHDTLPTMREYVERGELRIEWRDVNIYGADSRRAARASVAAALQGRHAQYHDALFAEGRPPSVDALQDDGLIALADQLGLDHERFVADLHSQQTAQITAENEAQGQELGVFSTPSFILAGEPLTGAQPTSIFTEKVDAALATEG